MNAIFVRMGFAALVALGGSGAALASGDCGMNSNKPCPPAGKSSAKEPAYKSLNSNKPASQRASVEPAPATVEAAEPVAARASLSGISASDLKIKPKTDKTIEKEPAQTP